MYSREIIDMLFAGQVSGLVENFNNGIYSDTLNVIKVNICMRVPLIELYPFVPPSLALITFQGHSNVDQF